MLRCLSYKRVLPLLVCLSLAACTFEARVEHQPTLSKNVSFEEVRMSGQYSNKFTIFVRSNNEIRITDVWASRIKTDVPQTESIYYEVDPNSSYGTLHLHNLKELVK